MIRIDKMIIGGKKMFFPMCMTMNKYSILGVNEEETTDCKAC